jgi:UDP-N-acetyl-D-mannosaminuronic acid transferase (WecB/TagA/CpsF family)
MTQAYLEWLARLLISPRRYAGRYLRDLPPFAYRLSRQKWGLDRPQSS